MLSNVSIKLVIICGAILLSACQTTQSLQQQGQENFRHQNYGVAFHQLYPLAKQGISSAEYAVGYMYYYGLGVKSNKPAAIQWMKQAAKQHNQDAQEALGLLAGPDWHTLPTRQHPKMIPLTRK